MEDIVDEINEIVVVILCRIHEQNKNYIPSKEDIKREFYILGKHINKKHSHHIYQFVQGSEKCKLSNLFCKLKIAKTDLNK